MEWPVSGRDPIPPAQDVPTAFWLTMHCAMAAGAVAMDRLAASARRIHVFMSVMFAPLDPFPIAIRAQCDVAPLPGGASMQPATLPPELHHDLPHG
jgi:hypothetical protein